MAGILFASDFSNFSIFQGNYSADLRFADSYGVVFSNSYSCPEQFTVHGLDNILNNHMQKIGVSYIDLDCRCTRPNSLFPENAQSYRTVIFSRVQRSVSGSFPLLDGSNFVFPYSFHRNIKITFYMSSLGMSVSRNGNLMALLNPGIADFDLFSEQGYGSEDFFYTQNHFISFLKSYNEDDCIVFRFRNSFNAWQFLPVYGILSESHSAERSSAVFGNSEKSLRTIPKSSFSFKASMHPDNADAVAALITSNEAFVCGLDQASDIPVIIDSADGFPIHDPAQFPQLSIEFHHPQNIPFKPHIF